MPSMSPPGDRRDNAVAERSLATLKLGLVEHERYLTRAAATASIRDYIDNFHELKRRHSRPAYMSPNDLEMKTCVTALAA
ncbi:hypothetical protein WMF04_23455 [Sorangium sp. So ce260]|uniref:hypothetical protein n=1 Tax=Sorangium sp. So ce260 TaxID=3133291 RepID=UPI003F61FA3A